MQKKPEPQTYQLTIQVKKSVLVNVGKLGRFRFPAGFYIYTGSAKRGMQNRLARHLSKKKKLRWHIDYLLADANVHVVEVDTFVESECSVNRQTVGEIIVKGFGAGDCRENCGSHLKYIGDERI